MYPHNITQPLAASSIFGKREKILTTVLCAAWMLYVLSLLISLPPYWALMDDHAHLASLPHIQKLGFIEWMIEFVKGEGGMFRPMYGAFIYLFYGFFGNQSSQTAYVALYGLNIFIFLYWGWAFSRCVQNKDCDGEVKGENLVWTLLYATLCFHFIRNNNLFYFASLQERLAILFLAPALHLAVDLSKKDLNKITAALKISSMGVFLILAACSKAPAISFIPVFSIWLFLLGLAKKNIRAGLFLGSASLIVLSLTAAYFFFSIRGGYTAGYQFENIRRELSDPGSKFYKIFWFAILTILVSIAGWIKRKDNLISLSHNIFWPLGMLAYTVFMLPWQGFLNYYLIIPVGMCWIGAKLIVFQETAFWLSKWKKLPYALFFILGVAITSITPMWKFYQKAIHHHGTGKAVEYLRTRIGRKGNHLQIRTAENCAETSSAIANFLGRPGFTPMAVSDDPFYRTQPQAGEIKLLITHRECPEFPASFAPDREAFRYHEWVIYEQTTPTA